MSIKNMKGLGKFDSEFKGALPDQFAVKENEKDTQLLSEESSIAPYETLFDEFNLEAYPFYNFWESDESSNGNNDRGNKSLDELPRYIKVTWNRAPDLQRPENQRLTPRSVLVRDIKTKIGLQKKTGYSFNSKGITFSPEHLSKNGFSLIKSSFANGYISPGVVEAVVEMPLHNMKNSSHRTHAKTSHIHHIDEDSFLTHPDMKGISIHEIKANINQLTNGTVNSSKVSKKSKKSKKMFDGKFSIGKSPFAGGNVQIDGVHSSSPALSILSRTAVSAQGEARDNVVDQMRKVVDSVATATVKRSAHNKVKFNYPVISGLLQQSKINMLTRPEHAESTIAIAQMLPNLQSLSDSGMKEERKHIEIPSFSSPPGLRPVEYIGYILEKYHGKQGGVFEKVAEYEITDKDQTDFIDTKVRYGEIYRYRIRSIVRWTRDAEVGPLGKDPLQIVQNGSQTKNTAPFKSSYFVGEWSRNWAYATLIDMSPPPPPDELFVRPESSRKRIHISCKLPFNPQKDISSMRLMRKLQSHDGQDITNWEVITESDSISTTLEFAPQNFLYVDEDVEFFQKSKIRYVYCAQSLTRHGEESTLSDQLAARVNAEWKVKGEYSVDFISCAGVKTDHFGAFSTLPQKRTTSEIVAVPKKTGSRVAADVCFSGRSAIGNATLESRNYVVRIESLDTGEIKDIDLTTSFKNLPSETKKVISDVVVQSHNQTIKNASSFGKSAAQKQRDNRNNNTQNLPPLR